MKRCTKLFINFRERSDAERTQPGKPTVYIETSVISYLASRPSRDVVIAGRQAISHDWWNTQRHRFELRVSALVEEEISHGDLSAAKRRISWIADIPSLAVSDEATELAELLLTQGAIPMGSEEDALHSSYRHRCCTRRRLPSHLELSAHE